MQLQMIDVEAGEVLANGKYAAKSTAALADNAHLALYDLLADTEIDGRVVKAAGELGVENGHKLRIDTTVVETDVHYPTDSSLLWDTVRVLTRLVLRLGEVVPAALEGFHNRTRRAKRRAYEITRMSRGRRTKQMQRKYRELIALTLALE